MAAIFIGLTGAAMLAIGSTIAWPIGGVLDGLWDLAGIAGVIVSVGLLEGV